MTKHQTMKTAEEAFNEATEGKDLSSGELSLLTSGLDFAAIHDGQAD